MLSTIFLFGVSASLTYLIGGALYNLYFHPLSSFPGPRLWIAFPVLRYLSGCFGTFDKYMQQYHAHYGEVVRFADDSLSFTTAEAWKDIYGYGHGSSQWPKLEFRPPGQPPNIVYSDDVDHARFRKALSSAFSDGTLRLQEGLIKGYVDMLVEALREEAVAERETDMTKWYNLTTFDIISDLAFGEPSGCLKNKEYSTYIRAIFKLVKVLPVVFLIKFYPLVWNSMMPFMGQRVMSSRDNYFKMGYETAMRRKNDRSKDGRGDFMEALLKYGESKEPISDPELAANAHILFVAGSETTATLLAGATFWMLKTPEAMEKATREVRQAFKSQEDITFSTAATQMPYTLACLEEGLRMYPPVPTCLTRITPGPSKVSGYDVPAHTQVGVHQMSANYSPDNFHEPNKFRPERWLPDAATDKTSPYFNDSREARQPFSVGPRNCIGRGLAFAEMRQILARVLWNFDLELVDDEQDWMDQRTFALREKLPLFCRVAMRKDMEKR